MKKIFKLAKIAMAIICLNSTARLKAQEKIPLNHLCDTSEYSIQHLANPYPLSTIRIFNSIPNSAGVTVTNVRYGPNGGTSFAGNTFPVLGGVMKNFTALYGPTSLWVHVNVDTYYPDRGYNVTVIPPLGNPSPTIGFVNSGVIYFNSVMLPKDNSYSPVVILLKFIPPTENLSGSIENNSSN